MTGGGALLLPKIKPIAEGSEDLDLIASVEHYGAGGAADAPRVISEFERQLVLTTLVLRWAGRGAARGTARS